MSTAPLLTASSAEDVLGYIPHALGYWPRNSLVVITVAENKLRATMRLDLPPRGTAGGRPAAVNAAFRRDFARQVSAALAADTQADCTVAALYSDEPWTSPAAAPHLGLMSALADRLKRVGMPLRDGWVVTDARWKDYFCTDDQCCPAAGRPLADILSSTLNVELIYRGSSYAADLAEAMRADAGLGRTPSPEVAHWYEHYRGELSGRWLREDQFFATLRLWQQLLDAGGVAGHGSEVRTALGASEITGFFLASLECKNLRDTLLVQAGMGPQLASEGIRACDALDASVGEIVLPGTVAAAEPAPDNAAGREPGEDLERRFCEVLLGASASYPDWPGLNRAFDVFNNLLKLSAGTPSAALLTMLAWIEWNRGRGSRADRLLTEALAEEPGYKLASLLLQLLERGTISRWAFSPKTAWRP